MISEKKVTFLWTAAGLLFSLAVLLVIAGALHHNVPVTDPESIPEAANTLMNSVHTADWDTLEAIVSGTYALAPAAGEEGSAERLIWNAYLQSLRWNCEGSYTVHGPYVSQSLTVTCLDIRAVTNKMMELLHKESGIPSAGDDATTALRSAAQQVLDSGAPTVHKEITLSFLREDRQWKAVPNDALLALLSGFMAR